MYVGGVVMEFYQQKFDMYIELINQKHKGEKRNKLLDQLYLWYETLYHLPPSYFQ